MSKVLFVSYCKNYISVIDGIEYFKTDFNNIFLEGIGEPWNDDEMNFLVEKISKYESMRGMKDFYITVINFKERK